jgi:hypothetical protein
MVPRALRICFLAESLFQILCAVPLMLFPNGVLGMCGWTTIDPVATRLVGAALFGIAGASLLSRRTSLETFRALLRLKILWTGAAVFSVVLSIDQGALASAWLLLLIVAGLGAMWTYWLQRLMALSAYGIAGLPTRTYI